MMHELLLAESTYRQMKEESRLYPDIRYVTINDAGQIKRDGEDVEEADLSIDMARLDISLFMTGQVKLISRLIDQADSFRFVQTSAAGLDSPLIQTTVSKTDVFCNSDAQSASIAEFVVASVLNRWHRFDVRRERQSAHQWRENFFKQILGSQWLIVGYGNIGQMVAKRVKGFGAQVTGVKRDLTPLESADQLISLDAIKLHVPEADVVVLSCPLNDRTSQLVNADFLALMKPDAVLVNIGRGLLVDEKALLAALDEGKLDYAIMDVFQKEPLPDDSVFWEHERVQMTPHSSHRGSKTEELFEALFTHNLSQFLRGKRVRNQVMPGSF